MFGKRISILRTFWQRQTEVAVNFALKLRERNIKTAIVDFDIVNPFSGLLMLKSTLNQKASG